MHNAQINLAPFGSSSKNLTEDKANVSGFAERSLTKSTQKSVSRDEMNLAEFPLAVLSTRVDNKVKTLEFTDRYRLPSGDFIERQWLITGADKFGLPTSTDDDVILGLIRLTMDQGFRERKVYFSRYELLKALRWSTEGRSYSRLIKSLDRLSGVRIRSTNSFYDNTTKSYQTCNFGVVDAYEINDHRGKKSKKAGETPRSYFIWSEMLFDSFKAGFIKKIDLDFYFQLKSAVSRRLYRYLDKHFYFRSVVEMPLKILAFEKIGLSRSYQYISSIKQQLEPACEELIKLGFLSAFEYNGCGDLTTVRFMSGSNCAKRAITESEKTGDRTAGRRNDLFESSNSNVNRRGEKLENAPASLETSLENSEPKAIVMSLGDQSAVVRELEVRGIPEKQSLKLLSKKTPAELEKIGLIISYYDFLLSKKDTKVSKNPVGFLYRAVETPYRFSIPVGFVKSKPFNSNRSSHDFTYGENKVGRPEHRIFRSQNRKPIHSKSFAEKENTDFSESEHDSKSVATDINAYRAFVDTRVSAYQNALSEEERNYFREAVARKISVMRTALTPERFQETLEGCIREEIISRISVPDIDTWRRMRG